jgi:hypothetical protein
LKKVLMIFGGLCAVIFLLLVILIAFIAYTGRGLDQESKAYADAAVVAITSQWNEQDLTDRASSQFMAAVKNPADLDRVVGMWRMLGPLKKYDGSKGAAHIDVRYPQGKTITAAYVARVEFDHNSAQIKISLIKLGGAWKILGFYVAPDSFPNPQVVKPNI